MVKVGLVLGPWACPRSPGMHTATRPAGLNTLLSLVAGMRVLSCAVRMLAMCFTASH